MDGQREKLTPYFKGDVTFAREEYLKMKPIYKKITDVLSGGDRIKELGTLYLPMPNETDDSDENRARYNAYVKRAVFLNIARKTLSSTVGLAFIRNPLIVLPEMMKPFIDNADGMGSDLEQLSKKAVSYNLAFSRGAVLVDFPSQTGATVADVEAGSKLPIIKVIHPGAIINWRTKREGTKEKLSLVVIYESFNAEDNGFEMKAVGQFRILYLDKEGFYTQDIYREKDFEMEGDKKNFMQKKPYSMFSLPNSNSEEYIVHERYEPTDAKGERIKEIPFKFFGAENNDIYPDNPIFTDLVDLNLAHYHNSADYEESCYLVGQPTPVVTGVTEDWVKNVMGGQIVFGSRNAIALPTGATASLIQAQENTMLKEAMDDKVQQMIALGAKLIEPKRVQKTATEADIDNKKEGSTLTSVVQNVSTVFDWACRQASFWVGAIDAMDFKVDKIATNLETESKTQSGVDLISEPVKFELNTNFDISISTPDEQRAASELYQDGLLTFNEMRTILRKAGLVTDEDDEAIIKITNELEFRQGVVDSQQPTKEPTEEKPNSGESLGGNVSIPKVGSGAVQTNQ